MVIVLWPWSEAYPYPRRVDSSLRVLRPTAEPAARSVLTGDPGWALTLAQVLLESPAPMFNHHRGLWGYCGPAADGSGRLLVQSTGVGGPSLMAVVSDLGDLGVSTVVRIGLAVSSHRTDPLLVAAEAVPLDGGSRSLSPDLPLRADVTLSDRFADAWRKEFGPEAAPPTVTVASRDVHDHQPSPAEERSNTFEASDLSTASLYAIGQDRRLRTLSLLLCGEPGDVDPRLALAGRLAAQALAD